MPCFEPPDERVELRARYDLDRELLARGISAYASGLPVVRRGRVLLVGSGVVVGLLAAMILPRPAGYIAGAVYALLMLAVAMRRVSRITQSSLALLQPEASGRLGEHLIEVTATTIVSSDRASRVQRRLNYVHAVERGDGILLIHMSPGAVIPIPSTADFGRDSFETFASKLEELHFRAKGSPSELALGR